MNRPCALLARDPTEARFVSDDFVTVPVAGAMWRLRQGDRLRVEHVPVVLGDVGGAHIDTTDAPSSAANEAATS